jgi:hypothetical protein
MMVTNTSGERSFSKLKRIKSELRSMMGQDRLAALSQMSIESDMLSKIDFSSLISEFAAKKLRKRAM